MNTTNTMTTKKIKRQTTALKLNEQRLLSDALDSIESKANNKLNAYRETDEILLTIPLEQLQAQLEREKITINDHIMRYKENLPKRMEDKTAPGMRLIRLALQSLFVSSEQAEPVSTWLHRAARGQSVPHGACVFDFLEVSRVLSGDKRSLEEIIEAVKASPDGLDDLLVPTFFIGLHVMVKSIGEDITHQRLAREVFSELSLSARAKAFEVSHRFLYERVCDSTKALSQAARNRVLQDVTSKQKIATDKSNELAIGYCVIHHIIEKTGFFSVESSDGHIKIIPSPVILSWLAKEHVKVAESNPSGRPMIIPPIPWHVDHNEKLRGGYVTLDKQFIHSKSSKDYSQECALDVISGSFTSHEVLNYLQEIPFRVNKDVLSVLQVLNANGIKVGKLFPLFNEPKPQIERPDPAIDPAGHEQYNKTMSKWYRAGGDPDSAAGRKILLSSRILSSAATDAQNDKIYFPGSLDFRGRMYFTTSGINPQGNDVSKGLLRFGEMKHVDRNTGIELLKVKIGDFLGFDKEPFRDRKAIADKHHDTLMAIAQEPLGEHKSFWLGADDPVQLLSTIFEYAKFVLCSDATVASDYIFRVDGTCNGLQHYSALLRSSITASEVACFDSDRPADIYTKVGALVISLLEKISTGEDKEIKLDSKTIKELEEAGGSQAEYLQKVYADRREKADRWLALLGGNKKLLRKICKAPTMTQTYGSTYQGKAAQVDSSVAELYDDGKFPEDAFKKDLKGHVRSDMTSMTTMLSATIAMAVDELTQACVEGQKFLSDCAGTLAKAGLHADWTLPDGHRVGQFYNESEQKRRRVLLGGQHFTVSELEETSKLAARKSRGGIPPNFIHSLDAYHLRQVVREGSREGIFLTTIHDSVGTHLADVDRVNDIIRQSFVAMYEAGDFLADFREACRVSLVSVGQEGLSKKLPDVPARGDFDIRKVLDSTYFFH